MSTATILPIETSDPDYLLKVVLTGDSGVGKTNLLSQFVKNTFNPESKTTIGVEFATKVVKVRGKTVKAQIWDTAGQEAYHSITASYFRSCQGVFLVFDITDEKSFKDLDYWINMIKEHSNTTSSNADSTPLIVVIANKIDCPKEKHQVDIETISNSCRERDLDYFITSALTGENVKNAADFMVKKLTERRRVKANEETINLTENTSTNKGCC